MSMTKPEELFLHELSDMYDAEQRIAKMLPLMAKECTNPQVKQAFEEHEQETQQQIQHLEQCFQLLKTKPEKAQCAAVAGMKQEHESFLKEEPSADILTLFDLSGASKTEYYEMASYKGLIENATQLGEKQIAQLLQENYQQEEAMAKKVEQLSAKLGQQMSSKTK